MTETKIVLSLLLIIKGVKVKVDIQLERLIEKTTIEE